MKNKISINQSLEKLINKNEFGIIFVGDSFYKCPYCLENAAKRFEENSEFMKEIDVKVFDFNFMQKKQNIMKWDIVFSFLVKMFKRY